MNLIVAGAGFALCLSGLLEASLVPHLDRQTRRFFTAFFILMLAYVLSSLFEQVAYLQTGPAWGVASRIALFLESALSSVLVPLLTVFIYYSSGESNWFRKKPVIAVIVILLVYFALLVYTQFSKSIYYYDADNVYHRGPFYPVLLIPPLMAMGINTYVFLHNRNRFSKREKTAFTIYLITPILAMLVQIIYYGIYWIVLGTTVSAFFMFHTIFMDQTERYYQQERENEQLKVDIMLSQIQPHFLYNVLGSIQSLCRTDPATAEKATAQFARYLRGNMDSLTQQKTVPFVQELDHTKIYLELEHLRFEDALQIRYDIRCTDFRVPTLTLQPLVENAVRYGVRKNTRGEGTVSISSREYPDRIEVVVIDDGPGFAPANTLHDERSHVGLANVRERLERVSGGRLEIETKPGKGTTVSMILPKVKGDR